MASSTFTCFLGLRDIRPMVMYWNDLLWKRLPQDLRLMALDEIENEFINLRDEKMMRYLNEKVV